MKNSRVLDYGPSPTDNVVEGVLGFIDVFHPKDQEINGNAFTGHRAQAEYGKFSPNSLSPSRDKLSIEVQSHVPFIP